MLTHEDEKYRQLLIIGNGFDLQCKLKSSYTEFLKKRREEGGNIDINGAKACNNLWDCIFYYYQELKNPMVDWQDIETVIKDFVTNKQSKITNLVYVLLYKKYFEGQVKLEQSSSVDGMKWHELGILISDFLIDKYSTKITQILNTNNKKHLSSDLQQLHKNISITYDSLDNKIKAVTSYETGKEEIKYIELDTDTFAELYFEELLNFEKDFAQYLIGEQELNHVYEKNSESLMINIIKDNMSGKSFKNSELRKIECRVLSFNYTELPSSFILVNSHMITAIKNVHGKLSDGNIIFGIDSAHIDNESNQHIIDYTKAFRTLTLTERIEMGSLLDGEVDVIKIYGHSLNEQDYSYFFSIFDKVNLYAGRTKLVVYYSVYDETTQSKESRKVSVALNKLLGHYGSTMDNSDHGKNLLHKIQLENRLRISELNGVHKLKN